MSSHKKINEDSPLFKAFEGQNLDQLNTQIIFIFMMIY